MTATVVKKHDLIVCSDCFNVRVCGYDTLYMNARLSPFVNSSPSELSSEYTTILFQMLSHLPARLIPQRFEGLYSDSTLVLSTSESILSTYPLLRRTLLDPFLAPT